MSRIPPPSGATSDKSFADRRYLVDEKRSSPRNFPRKTTRFITSGARENSGFRDSQQRDTKSTFKKDLGRAACVAVDETDNSDVDKLKAAASSAVKMEQRLKDVEVERARELGELQKMMSSLQRKEEELSKFVSAVQKRRQETDPYEKAQARIQELERELQKALDQSLMDTEHRRLREDAARLNGYFERIAAAVEKVKSAEKEVIALADGDEEDSAPSGPSSSDTEHVTKLTEEMLGEAEELKVQLNMETSKRKKLHNQLVNLRGAIRVFCRVRPLVDAAGQRVQGSVCTEVDEAADAISLSGARENAYRPHETKEKKFHFDRVFATEATQAAIYDETSAVVTSVMDGYNVCIFAYGQTGSGKTYTMEGPGEDRGVNYRTLAELFEIARQRRSQMEYTFRVSLVEVYNDEVRDLLDEHVPEVTWTTHSKSSGPSRPHLDLRVQPDGSVDVPGLITEEVDSVSGAWGILKRASAVRSSGETKSNMHSSRSHCLLRVTVQGCNKINKDVMSAKLWLVDLAGSERVAKSEASGERLREAQCINRSLSALGDCIYALSTKSQHVPFRNSKLTHMLADSLGGDSKTVMFVHVSPSLADFGETTCSLNFASRVRGVEIGPAKRHVESNASEVQKAKIQAADLKAQVEELQEHKLAQQKKIREMTMALENLRDENRRHDKTRTKLERKIAKLQEKLGAEDEVECEEEDEVSMAENEHLPTPDGNSWETFLAPTASPVYKAAVRDGSFSCWTTHDAMKEVGSALKNRTSDGCSPESISVVVESLGVQIPQPKSQNFKARFADFRTKPDRAEDSMPSGCAETENNASDSKGRKKKSGIFSKRRKWIGFF